MEHELFPIKIKVTQEQLKVIKKAKKERTSESEVIRNLIINL